MEAVEEVAAPAVEDEDILAEEALEEELADDEDETFVESSSEARLVDVAAEAEDAVEEAPADEPSIEAMPTDEEAESWSATEEPPVPAVEAVEQPALDEVEEEDTPEIAEEAPDGSLSWEAEAEEEDEPPSLEAVAEPEDGPSLAWEEESEPDDEALSEVAPMPSVSEVSGLQTVQFTPEVAEEAAEVSEAPPAPEDDIDTDGTVLLSREAPAETATSEMEQVEAEEPVTAEDFDADETHPGRSTSAAQAPEGDSMFRSPPAEVKANQVAPPEDIDGPGWAFSQTPKPSAADDELHEKARRLARLLVSEIKLYNEEQVEEGRRNKNIYDRLKEDIDRSRQMYEDRVDERVRNTNDYFYQELVRTLAAGDSQALGI
jgi:hypothetical protein